MDKTRKKICYVCYRRFPDTNFENYSKYVSNGGYEVTVLSFLSKGQQPFELRDRRKIYRIPMYSNRGKRINQFYFLLKVIQFLKKNNFSIIHIHHTCAYFSLIKFFTSKKAKLIYHTTSYPIQKSHLNSVKKMVFIFLQCLLMNKIIVQSVELKEKLIGIRSLNRTQVVPVGFDKQYFYPTNKEERSCFRELLNIQENHSVLVYCGVIAKLRQLDQLLWAIKQVMGTFNNIKLLMIGDGNALEDLKLLAHSIQIENSVIFMGAIPHNRVRSYLCVADIGISYIPINENYNYNPPLKTFEYLACGLPTIATRTESNCRIIKDGFNGILVNDSSEDIAAAIATLLKDKNKQNILRKNARKSIMSFDFELITKRHIIPLYEDLISINRSTSLA